MGAAESLIVFYLKRPLWALFVLPGSAEGERTMNGWTETAEQIEARRRRIVQDFVAFPGDGLGEGLTEALTTPGHMGLLIEDYREALQQCDQAAARLKTKTMKPKRFSLLALFGVAS
jgi:hypothetical protein